MQTQPIITTTTKHLHVYYYEDIIYSVKHKDIMKTNKVNNFLKEKFGKNNGV
jgi:hypothetical protein